MEGEGNRILPSPPQPDLSQTLPDLGLGSGGCSEPFPSLSSELRPKAQGDERYWPLWVAGVWLGLGEVEVENVAE